jgi:hypothetical protein
VDSNNGWLADEILAAIRSSIMRNDYVLDRPQLVEWFPVDGEGGWTDLDEPSA